jgi:hypothetical protein
MKQTSYREAVLTSETSMYFKAKTFLTGLSVLHLPIIRTVNDNPKNEKGIQWKTNVFVQGIWTVQNVILSATSVSVNRDVQHMYSLPSTRFCIRSDNSRCKWNRILSVRIRPADESSDKRTDIETPKHYSPWITCVYTVTLSQVMTL